MKAPPLSLCGVALSNIPQFFDRFLTGVGGKQKRAVCIVYLNVSVYIF